MLHVVNIRQIFLLSTKERKKQYARLIFRTVITPEIRKRSCRQSDRAGFHHFVSIL
jgi:hypothetical protein